MNKLHQLPKDWTCIKLDDALDFIIGGDWGKDENFEDPNYAFAYCIRGSEIRHWEEEKGRTASLRKIKRSNIEKRKLVEGDILIEISGGGPEQPVGRTVLIDKIVLSYKPEIPKICTNFLRLIRPKDYINSKFLNLYLKHFYYSGEIVKYQGGSNNLRNLKFPDYIKIQIPLPPKPIQQAIVSKIEELFSELDKGIEQLKTAQQQLKTYRQSVLKWAFEGKLTNGLNYDSYDLTDEPDLHIAAESGVDYKRKSNQDNQDNPVNYSSDKGELPKGWKVKSIGDIFEVFIGSTPKRNISEYWEGDINWVSSGEIAFCDITKTREKITQEGLKNTSCKIHPIGTVIIAMIGEGKTRGQAAILKIEASHNQNTAAIRVNDKVYNSKLLYYYLVLKYEDNRKVGSGNNQKALNKERVKSILIPLPPILEQNNIVQEIESRLSVADKMEESIIQSLQQAEVLRQSILKKAFEGKLIKVIDN